MKRILFIISILAFTAINAQDRTLYGNQYVSQSMRNNPGFMPKYKFHLGLPVLSNNLFAFSSPSYALSDIFIGNGANTPTDLNVASILENSRDVNSINFNMTFDLLSFGFRVKEINHFTFSASFHNDLSFSMSDGFVQLLMNGNAGPGMLGVTHSIDNTGLNTTSYLDFGLTYTREVIKDKLTVGIRPRFLMGIGHASTTSSAFTLSTDPNTFAIQGTSSVDVRVGGIGDPLTEDFGDEIMNSITGSGSSGFAVDFGGTYQLDEKTLLSFNVNDLGSIKWNNGVSITRQGTASIGYTPDSVLLSDDEDAFMDYVNGIFGLPDSAEVDDILTSTDNSGFSTGLNTRINIGASYQYNDYLILSGLAQARFVDGGLSPSLTVGGNLKLNDVLYVSLNYSAIDGTYDNIGAALTLNAGPIQMFVASDNIFGLTAVDYTHYLNAQFGINIITGYSDKKAEKKANKKASKGQKKTKSDNKESTKKKDDAKPKKEKKTEESK